MSNLVEKWGQISAAIQRTSDPRKKKLIAGALENQERHINEAVSRGQLGSIYRTNDQSLFGTRDLNETNIVSGDIATFTKQSLAMVDMVFEQIVIDELVHIMTMDGPTAFVHHVAYKQGSAGLYVAGTDFNTGLDPDYSDCPAEAASGACSASKDVDFALTATTVTAACKRLTARYTTQAEQDMSASYGSDLGDDLRQFMATELRREIQEEVIEQLIANASTTVTWAKAPPGGSVYANLDPKVYQQTLYDAILSADNGIFKSADGFRGANWICGDPDSLLRLEQLESFSITSDMARSREDALRGDVDRYANKFGVANHRFDVWKMRFMPADTILLGTKSDSAQEIGHIHGVYVPVADLGTFRDPRTSCVDIGMMTRYGNSTIRPGLFATVTLT